MRDGLDLSVIVMIMILPFALAQIAILRRHSRKLSLALSFILGALVLYSIMNVPMIETPLNRAVPGVTVLGKDLSIIGVMCGANLMFWALGLRRRVWVWFRWAVPMVLIVMKIVLWVDLRHQCEADTGFIMDGCYFVSGWFTLSEMAVLLCVALWGCIAIAVLWKNAGFSHTQGRVLSLFVFAFIAAVAWSLVATVGISEIYLYGHYTAEQYILRPVLSLVGAVAFSIALVIIPLKSIFSRFSLRWRLRPVISVLDDRNVPSALDTQNIVTDVMDRLGVLLHKESTVPIEHSSSDDSAVAVGRWLVGMNGDPPMKLPSESPTFTQRAWLIKVAKVVRYESQGQ